MDDSEGRDNLSRARRARQRVSVELRARWRTALLVLVPAGTLYVVGAASGGFFPRTWRLTLLAAAALIAAALVARERVTLTLREWVVIGALAAFTGWTAASKFWSGQPSTSLLEAERALLYVAAIAAVLVCVGRTSLPLLLSGMVVGITAVCGYGLVDYLISRPPLDPFQGSLLFVPFGYANALGVFAAIGIALTIGLALSVGSWRVRAAVAAPLIVLFPTLLLTSSRGAWVALPIGVITTLYVGRRLRSRFALLALLVAGIAVSLVLSSVRGQSFSIVGANRPTYWRIAWQDYAEHPLLGSGAGTYYDYWLHHQPIPEFVHNAHSLYVETLAELGPLGLALLLVGLGVPLLGLGGRQEPVVAAAAGGYVTFLVHVGVDWDWEMPAVTLAGLLCGAAVLVGTRAEGTAALPTRARVALLAGALLLLAFAFARLERTGGLRLSP